MKTKFNITILFFCLNTFAQTKNEKAISIDVYTNGYEFLPLVTFENKINHNKYFGYKIGISHSSGFNKIAPILSTSFKFEKLISTSKFKIISSVGYLISTYYDRISYTSTYKKQLKYLKFFIVDVGFQYKLHARFFINFGYSFIYDFKSIENIYKLCIGYKLKK